MLVVAFAEMVPERRCPGASPISDTDTRVLLSLSLGCCRWDGKVLQVGGRHAWSSRAATNDVFIPVILRFILILILNLVKVS